jgi:hypothetical protein
MHCCTRANVAVGVSEIVHELVTRGIKGTLRREATAAMLGELVELHQDMASIVTDVLSVVDAETSCSEQQEERQRYCLLTKEAEKVNL